MSDKLFDRSNYMGAFFFKGQALGTDTSLESGKLNLGNMQGGIRVKGWTNGPVACASGNTITAVLKVSDDGSTWTNVHTGTLTTTGTSMDGEILSYLPDTGKKYMKVAVTTSTGMTGSFSIAQEYVAR